jgi:hypothetical protein
MTYLIPSGKTAIDKYDNRTVNAEKVLPRLDMRLLASNLQYLAEITQGYSLSGDEGYSQAQNLLSTITASNYTDYSNALSKMISTLVAHRNFLDVDPSSTANGIILIKSKITTEDAPSAVGNFTREEELPFKFKSNLSFTFKAKDTNTGSVTVNIVGLNGLSGSIPLKNQDGDNLSPNDIIQNYIYEITSDTVNNCFILTPHLRKATNLVQGISYLNNPITIANNSTDANNDIDFSAGNFQFADGSGQAVLSALTKRLDASWTAGTNQGGLDTGTKQASRWYYCYAIYNPITGVSDCLYSLSSTNPILPSGFTKKKLISLIYNSSTNSIAPAYWTYNSIDFVNPLLLRQSSQGNALLYSETGLAFDCTVTLRAVAQITANFTVCWIVVEPSWKGVLTPSNFNANNSVIGIGFEADDIGRPMRQAVEFNLDLKTTNGQIQSIADGYADYFAISLKKISF